MRSLISSFFSGNSALNKGGAVFIDNLPMKIMNSTFKANQANFGGAIYMRAKSKADI